jgi:pyridinium-3,5-biscarboxylic acid mononucleotide sulfurtransferase
MVINDLAKLKKFFSDNKNIALCFSGGLSSSYLLFAGLKYRCNISAYYVKSEFQSETELKKAINFAKQHHADLRILDLELLSDPEIVRNRSTRCYLCKKRMIELIESQSKRDGYSILIDGTTDSHKESGCLNQQAQAEFSVCSPLKDCGITKFNVRSLLRKSGFNSWDTTSYSCLASRVPAGTKITAIDLKKIGRAEQKLSAIGLEDVRVELIGRYAKLKIHTFQMENVVKKREKIIELLGFDFDSILLELTV